MFGTPSEAICYAATPRSFRTLSSEIRRGANFRSYIVTFLVLASFGSGVIPKAVKAKRTILAPYTHIAGANS